MNSNTDSNSFLLSTISAFCAVVTLSSIQPILTFIASIIAIVSGIYSMYKNFNKNFNRNFNKKK